MVGDVRATHERGIRRGIDLDGLLKQPEEEFHPAPARAAIEPKRELIEVEVEMVGLDATLKKHYILW